LTQRLKWRQRPFCSSTCAFSSPPGTKTDAPGPDRSRTSKRIQLFLALDALGQHAHLEHAPEIEDGLQNRRLLTRNRQVGDQAAVDLHQVNRQTDEVVHGGQAGAEVIQGGAYFQISHALKNRQGASGS
jgi:hypothetical protein